MEELLRERRAFLEPFERLAGPAARGEDAPRVVQHDDDLAALLDEHVGAFRVHPRDRCGLLLPAESLHHSFTTCSPARLRAWNYRRSEMTRVLIVEDDEVIAEGMARHLEAGGFDAVGVGERASRGWRASATSSPTSASST